MKAKFFLLISLALFFSQIIADPNFLGFKENKVEEISSSPQNNEQQIVPEMNNNIEENTLVIEATPNVESYEQIVAQESTDILNDVSNNQDETVVQEKVEENVNEQSKEEEITEEGNLTNNAGENHAENKEGIIHDENDEHNDDLEDLEDLEEDEEDEGTCPNEEPAEVFDYLTPEQRAYRETHYAIPNIPEGWKMIKKSLIRTDKTIMKSYSFSIPSFLLKGIASHHKFIKSNLAEEKEQLLKRGFLMPGPYMLDLVYIFRKKTEEGYFYLFGVVVNRCLEKACETRPYSCKNTAHFISFEPTDGVGKRRFADWKIDMAPEGYMQCPNYII